ncbi:Protein unc-80-like protein [Hypsibius exemplaris]|uniref:Protein unc-80-like protein n=1 Tax=Hypsibius exemplaris TaxID=2072580 RepID=A0A1W0X7A8_HYPEX|nr:Protein unc-80-like protein [Hypsibius exemplaris]
MLNCLSKSTAEVQISHSDVEMLLSVLNGVLILHCQDSAILRLCLSTFVTVARNMKSLFATTGFLSIMPTLLDIYATHQANDIVTGAIEFTCSQLFILHRNPFLLQLFGSAAALLQLTTNETDNAKPLRRSHIKNILFSLEKYGRRPSKPFVPPTRSENNQAYHPLDYLDVLELVDSKKPLQPLDLCYQNDMYDFSPVSILTSAVSSCIAVIAFDTAESPRGTQMLQVLRTLVHEEVWYDEKPADTTKSAKEELQKIIALAGSLKSLIFSCESLTRPFTVPQRTVNSGAEVTRHLGSLAPSFVPHHSKDHDVEAGRPRITVQETFVDTDSQWEFSSPRNHLLAIIAHFLTSATSRIHQLSKFVGDLSTRPPEIIDAKSHIRLSEIAQTLLKVAPYDQEVMACEGLQLYMTEILPTVDFSVESLKQTLQQLLRRVDKTFIKVMKKPNSKRETNWNAAAKIIEGLTKTLCHNNLIALMPQLRSITGNCISMTLAEPGSAGSELALSTIPHAVLINTPSVIQPSVASIFRQATIDLCAVYLQAGKEYCNLEQLSAQFSDQLFRLVVCILLPLVLRLGSGGTSDLPALRIEDLRYIIRALIQLLHPPLPKQQLNQHHSTGQSIKLTVTSNMTRTNSNMSNPPSGGGDKDKGPTSPTVLAINKQQDLSRRVAFLGLKIVIVCYEGRLGSEWLRLAKSIEDYGDKGNVGLAFWQFLEYTIVYRTALFVHLVPFAARILDTPSSSPTKKLETSLSEQEEQVQASIRSALAGNDNNGPSKAPELIFTKISQEISTVLEEYIAMSSAIQPSRSPTTIVAEENSIGEASEGILRLADLARFRAHGKRKDSTQVSSVIHHADRSSSSGGGNAAPGKRSPPIVIPVVVERTEPLEANKANSEEQQVGLDRKRSTLIRQRAQYGLGEGNSQHHPPAKKRTPGAGPANERSEAMEMMQILKGSGATTTLPSVREQLDHVTNNVVPPTIATTTRNTNSSSNNSNSNSKVIPVSVVNSRKQSKDKTAHRRQSVDSLNDDENIKLLK